MARTSTYLNFSRNTQEAFEFYKAVFKTEFLETIRRFSDLPLDSHIKVAETDKNLVLHIELPILGGHILMGTDRPESTGFKINFGNNVYINLEPDSRDETERLFAALSSGGKIEMPLQDMFWGDYSGCCTDKFGINWRFNCSNN